jgi:guanylate kinase
MTIGNLFIVAAPSGAGKTTLVGRLLARDTNLALSISYTTRVPRPGEVNGRDYHFVDESTFAAIRERGEFAEWAEVHGNFYGTSRAQLEARMASGTDVVLEIDWQGAQQVRRQFPSAVGIFILPPSLGELERRLRGRGSDSDAVIERRLAASRNEMRHVDEFDFVIINREVDAALDELISVVKASRLRVSCQRARHPDVFRLIELD